jgi:hypothetical protein
LLHTQYLRLTVLPRSQNKRVFHFSRTRNIKNSSIKFVSLNKFVIKTYSNLMIITMLHNIGILLYKMYVVKL